MKMYGEKQVAKQVEDSVRRSSIELTITFMEVLKEQYGWDEDQLDELAQRVNSQAEKRMAEMRRYNGTGSSGYKQGGFTTNPIEEHMPIKPITSDIRSVKDIIKGD
jgi:hypothetical protein